MAERINEEHLAGKKRQIFFNELICEVEMDTIRREVYYPSAPSGEPLDYLAVEEIAEFVCEDEITSLW